MYFTIRLTNYISSLKYCSGLRNPDKYAMINPIWLNKEAESRISDSIMRPEITRRDFLKLCGAAAAGFGFTDFPPGGDPLGKRSPFVLTRARYLLTALLRAAFDCEP